MSTASKTKAVVLGCFQDEENGYQFTPSAQKYLNGVDLSCFKSQILKSKFSGKSGSTRLFYDVKDDADCIVLTGLGKKGLEYCPEELIDTSKENVRCAINAALKVCKEMEFDNILFDDCLEPKAVGESAVLSSFCYEHLKGSKKEYKPQCELLNPTDSLKSYEEGVVLGECQNFARYLSETPANHMTPVIAGETIKSELSKYGVEVLIRDENWIRDKNMGLFLSVAQGSENAPRLVEMHYKGFGDGSENVIVLVGKGITFDAGGVSIKPSAAMHEMKADMQGGSCVAASVLAASRLKLKCNLIGIVPFTENVINGKATKPGDVHTSMNGKSVEIQNTDAEGRLVLADALEYAQTFNPFQIIDLATLTGAICVALGGTCSAIYTHDQKMFEEFEKSGATTGDRVWRMPLFSYYKDCMKSNVADLNNISNTRYGGSCTAAAFLKEFVKMKAWAHLDIACSMISHGEIKYLENNFMTGRPTRTIVEYLSRQQH